MGRHSFSLIFFVFVFGVLFGAALLTNFNYFHNESQQASSARMLKQFKTGTERLKYYKCAVGETKQILLGGIEDDFDPEGEEQVRLFPNQDKDFLSATNDHKLRNYDEAGQDKIFVSRFDVTARTYHGIAVVKFRELSKVRNDSMNIYLEEAASAASAVKLQAFRTPLSKIEESGWTKENRHYWINLKNLKLDPLPLKDTKQRTSVSNILDLVRQQTSEQDVIVRIGDDTQVDFVGFALCLEPVENLGTVYSSRNVFPNPYSDNIPDGLVYLEHAIVDGKVCVKNGCRQCDTALPVACINDENIELPSDLAGLKAIWSGGNIAFTKPVPATDFETEDDLDAFCEIEIGEDWRVLNIKDGSWQGKLAGYGQLPENSDEFWIGVKNSSHYTCWETRRDYGMLEATDD